MSILRFVAGAVALSAGFAGVVGPTRFAQSAPATMPTSQPAASVSNSNAQGVVADMWKAMREDRDADALASAKQPLAAYGRGKVADDTHAEMLFATAVAYMRTKDDPKARDPMDRAAGSKMPITKSREFLLDYAKLDLIHKNFTVRAAKTLDAYLGTVKAPDEEAVNLFGGVIQRLTLASTSPAVLDPLVANFKKYDQALKASHPGQERWGPNWVSTQDYQQKSAKFKSAESRLAVASKDVATKQRAYDAESTRLDRVKRDSALNGRGFVDNSNHAQLDSYASLLAEAKEREAGCSKALNELRPDWPVDLTPVIPGAARDSGTAETPMAARTSPSPMLEQLLSTYPEDNLPHAGEKWNDITAGYASEWLTKAARGKKFTLTGKYVGGAFKGGSVSLNLQAGSFAAGKVQVESLYVSVALSPQAKEAAAQLRDNSEVTIVGDVNSVEVYPARAPGSAKLTIELSRGTIE